MCLLILQNMLAATQKSLLFYAIAIDLLKMTMSIGPTTVNRKSLWRFARGFLYARNWLCKQREWRFATASDSCELPNILTFRIKQKILEDVLKCTMQCKSILKSICTHISSSILGYKLQAILEFFAVKATPTMSLRLAFYVQFF